MDIIQETLRWVNSERVARGIGAPLEDLPKGEPTSIHCCPVANALGGGSDVCVDGADVVYGWCTGGEEETVRLPEAVAEFIEQFDGDQFPEYRS